MSIQSEEIPFSNNIKLNSGVTAKLFALVVLALVLTVVWIYPFGSIALSIFLVLYFILIIKKPLASLFVIPAFLASIHLSPWSGWLLVEEFDFLIITTVAASIYFGLYSHKAIFKNTQKLGLVLSLLFVVYIIGFVQGFFPIQQLDANAISSYYTNYLSFRLFKNLLWVVLIMPLSLFCFVNYPQASKKTLVLGISMGLCLVGLSVLWERGVFRDILNFSDRYQIFENLLDFTAEHRVTALFSDMHTGGEAIDGYLVLVLPFALALLVSKEIVSKKLVSKEIVTKENLLLKINYLMFAVGAIAILLGLYSVLSTFTRATYVATFAAIAVFLMCIFASKVKTIDIKAINKQQLLVAGIACLVFISSMLYVFPKGGLFSVFGCAFAFIVSIIILGFFGSRNWHKALPVYFIVFFITAFIISRGMLTSKWVSNDFFGSWIVSALLAALNIVAGTLLFYFSEGKFKVKQMLGYVIVASMAFMFIIPATQGYRMDVRLSTSADDFKTRFEHWQKVESLISDNISSKLFGMGLGTYPREYLFNIEKAGTVGTYSYKNTNEGDFLLLGGGTDLGLGQRVSIDPATNYKVKIRIRSLEAEPRIQFLFCKKNLLYQIRGDFCSGRQIKNITKKWQDIELVINSKFVGEGSWIERWPSVFMIFSKEIGSLIEIDSISVLDSSGVNILKNGEFDKGGDNWYSYNDYEHLQWHIKNFWLNIYYEMGWIGVLVFASIFLWAYKENWRKAKKGSVLHAAILAALIGIQLQGMFGSMMDAPRIAFLLLYLLSISFFPDNVAVSESKSNENANQFNKEY